MRKAFALVLLVAALLTVGAGLAQAGDHGKHEKCTAEQVLINTQCVHVNVSPEIGLAELPDVGDVVDDLNDVVGGLL